MCGITGWASFHGDARSQAPVLEAMTATLAPRGPDAQGLWLGERAAIGHRRLAVIDPAGGLQPMTDRPADPTVVLSYSGEVYNHHELRTRLRARGHAFHTRSDTEVVLRGTRSRVRLFGGPPIGVEQPSKRNIVDQRLVNSRFCAGVGSMWRLASARNQGSFAPWSTP